MDEQALPTLPLEPVTITIQGVAYQVEWKQSTKYRLQKAGVNLEAVFQEIRASADKDSPTFGKINIVTVMDLLAASITPRNYTAEQLSDLVDINVACVAVLKAMGKARRPEEIKLREPATEAAPKPSVSIADWDRYWLERLTFATAPPPYGLGLTRALFWDSTDRELEAFAGLKVRHDQPLLDREMRMFAVERADFRNVHFRKADHQLWTVDEILGRRHSPETPTRAIEHPVSQSEVFRMKMAASGILKDDEIPDWAKATVEASKSIGAVRSEEMPTDAPKADSPSFTFTDNPEGREEMQRWLKEQARKAGAVMPRVVESSS